MSISYYCGSAFIFDDFLPGHAKSSHFIKASCKYLFQLSHFRQQEVTEHRGRQCSIHTPLSDINFYFEFSGICSCNLFYAVS